MVKLNTWLSNGYEKIYLIIKKNKFYYGVYFLNNRVVFDMWREKEIIQFLDNFEKPKISISEIHKEIIKKIWNIGFKLK